MRRAIPLLLAALLLTGCTSVRSLSHDATVGILWQMEATQPQANEVKAVGEFVVNVTGDGEVDLDELRGQIIAMLIASSVFDENDEVLALLLVNRVLAIVQEAIDSPPSDGEPIPELVYVHAAGEGVVAGCEFYLTIRFPSE